MWYICIYVINQNKQNTIFFIFRRPPPPLLTAPSAGTQNAIDQMYTVVTMKILPIVISIEIVVIIILYYLFSYLPSCVHASYGYKSSLRRCNQC